ncbi:MAG TPA: hypothetical protein VF234_01015 [Limnochordia bacterium]
MQGVLAYFPEREMAERGAAALREAGFDDVRIERIGRYPELAADRRYHPLSGDFGSLANLTLGAAVSGDDGILLAADPAASGMAGGESPPDRAWLVACVAEDASRAEAAQRILQPYGATL